MLKKVLTKKREWRNSRKFRALQEYQKLQLDVGIEPPFKFPHAMVNGSLSTFQVRNDLLCTGLTENDTFAQMGKKKGGNQYSFCCRNTVVLYPH